MASFSFRPRQQLTSCSSLFHSHLFWDPPSSLPPSPVKVIRPKKKTAYASTRFTLAAHFHSHHLDLTTSWIWPWNGAGTLLKNSVTGTSHEVPKNLMHITSTYVPAQLVRPICMTKKLSQEVWQHFLVTPGLGFMEITKSALCMVVATETNFQKLPFYYENGRHFSVILFFYSWKFLIWVKT